jgi:hypothetical protein
LPHHITHTDYDTGDDYDTDDDYDYGTDEDYDYDYDESDDVDYEEIEDNTWECVGDVDEAVYDMCCSDNNIFTGSNLQRMTHKQKHSKEKPANA